MCEVIIDCYTDEPSGLGVPPYLSVHSRYIASYFESKGREYYYLTIDDLRYANNEKELLPHSTNKRIRNLTKNHHNVQAIMEQCDNISVVMGCFVDYEYVSAAPPTFEEIQSLLSYDKPKTLFYVLGIEDLDGTQVANNFQPGFFSEIITGLGYNYYLENNVRSFEPNYPQLNFVNYNRELVNQLKNPAIVEIETSTGCNQKPGCSFCIESIRGLPLSFRTVEDIIDEVYSLYTQGIRHFRLGRQPNFYAYRSSSPSAIEKLLSGIREKCPDLKMLHIDNVGPQDVVTKHGKEITKHIVKYCTSSNIAPFGIESFDPQVRGKCNLNGTIEQIMEAVYILNEAGGNEIADDGFPKFLPGLNLIYGLEGQSERTFEHNMNYLNKIMERGLMTRRLFLRKLTDPRGTLLDKGYSLSNAEFENWGAHIARNFEIPMLQRVFPVGRVLKEIRCEIVTDGSSLFRQLSTCPTRIIIPDEMYQIDTFEHLRVTGYLNNRTLTAEVIR